MNSFFASCEQQFNYYLRKRPVGVCVYTGRNGCIISPSIEAKKFGVKTGMRLPEAMKLCPDLVPLETNPARYRETHIEIMKMLRSYCQEVYPKSIDEAIIDLSTYKHIYKDPLELAKEIKYKISDIGDWLKCSIGIAPNAFLAKLASDLQKPDGLVTIFPENIDEVLSKLQLTDLPGIAGGLSAQLIKAGIKTPLELRYASSDKLRSALKSVVGIYWHDRLNFKEVDIDFHEYKTMQAMRQVSASQRQNVQTMENLLVSLCMMLEKRMVGQGVYAKDITVFINYEDNKVWSDRIHAGSPVQEGTKILDLIKARMKKFRETHHSDALINTHISAMGVTVSKFVPADALVLDLFEDTVKQDKLRQTVYNLKDKFGYDKLLKAIELSDDNIMSDVIGFGSVKDMYDKSSPSVV
ncbi:MAG: DNA polymerase IV [Bacteroidia bacterium]